MTKQLLYLGGNPAPYRSIAEKQDIIFSSLDIQDYHSLHSFIKTEKSLVNQDFFVLDLQNTIFSPSHIIQTIIACKAMAKCRIIVLTENAVLAGQVSQNGIQDVICTADEEMPIILEKFSSCLGERKSYTDIAAIVRNGITEKAKAQLSSLIPPIPEGMSLDIAVYGCCPRIGTTTQAIGLYHYFQSMGFSPMIIDHSGGLLKYAKNTEDYHIEEDHVCNGNVKFSSHVPNGNPYNILIHDFGVINQHNADDIVDCDIEICCGGVKTSEIMAMYRCMEYMGTRNIIRIISFSGEAAFAEIQQKFSNDTYKAPYMPEYLYTDYPEFYKQFIPSAAISIIEQWN